MDKKTYGQQLIDHRTKNLTVEDDVIEYRRTLEPDIIAHLQNTATAAKENDLYRDHNFYVVMLTRMERMGNVPRNQFLARRSCPTPTYKQSVWKYHIHSDHLEYLWTLPDEILYWHIIRNKQQYLKDKETQELTQFVLLNESGELLEWVKKENGEKPDAIIFNYHIQEDEACSTIITPN